jgi:hypothetical protein
LKLFLSIIAMSFFFSASQARADIFAFKDLKGFEACLLVHSLKETIQAGGAQQERFLDQPVIQQRCVQSAVKILNKGNPTSANILDFVKTTKRNSAHEQSLDLIGVLAAKDAKACNDMEAYSVLKSALSHPQDYPSAQNSYFEKTKRIVKLCSKDAEFKKDFLEEKDSSESYVATNACAILLAEKAVKSCPKK